MMKSPLNVFPEPTNTAK